MQSIEQQNVVMYLDMTDASFCNSQRWEKSQVKEMLVVGQVMADNHTRVNWDGVPPNCSASPEISLNMLN